MLELIDLQKRYGDVIALDGLDLVARPGRVLGFVGPNGSGKTTTMRSIFGLVAPDRGEVRWRGEAIGRAERGRFGYMPEARGLYPKMRVHEQIVYFARLHGLATAEAQDAATGWLERLGLSDRRDDPVEALSHGNQQRVQLAVALVHEPELLVLDEPFSGLDPLAVNTLERVIHDEAERGATVVFSSHQLELVEGLCQDVLVIAQGRAVLSGELEELRRASGVRYLEVSLSGAAGRDSWVPPVEGIAVLRRDSGGLRLQLPADTDIAPILASAQEAGEVYRFSFEPPSLPELFLETVGGSVGR